MEKTPMLNCREAFHPLVNLIAAAFNTRLILHGWGIAKKAAS